MTLEEFRKERRRLLRSTYKEEFTLGCCEIEGVL
jgi:hypothetical protein